MRSVIPWSWSQWEAYETCPRAFYEIKLAKNFIETDDKQYLIWGNEVHTALELRVGQGVPLPERMIQYEPMAYSLSNAPGIKYCELETAVNSEYLACGYWDDDCYNRGKEDLVIVNGNKAIDIDYKTGKPKTNTQQLELSAARVMAKFPEVHTVHTAYAWLQTGKWTRATYTRDDLSHIWEGFVGKVGDMIWSEKNNTWPAKPSGLCKRSKRVGSTYAGCIVATCPHSEYYRRDK